MQTIHQVHRNKNGKLGKMRKQKHFFKIKKKDKTTEKDLSEVEICNLSNKEFIKVMITKMFKELGKRFDEQSEKLTFFNKQKI